DGPIPAVGGLDHHLRLRTGLAHLRSELQRIVVDAHAVELPARRVHPIDHRPAAMQINPDVLSLHRGLPCRAAVGSPDCDNARVPTGSGGPAPSPHHFGDATTAT